MSLRLLKAQIFLRVWAFFLSFAVALPPLYFKEAKEIMLRLYQEHPQTFYCECPFNSAGIVTSTSLLLPINTPDDLLTLEWEHVVPASLLGRNLSCWNKKQCPVPVASNRQCCRRTSDIFNEREADLYNLVPSIKLSNRARSNFRPSKINDPSKAQRVCKILIDKKNRVFEPDDDLKGFIARTYLRMATKYSLDLSESDKLLFQQWDMLYPKDDWEIRREALIDQIYRKPIFQGDFIHD